MKKWKSLRSEAEKCNHKVIFRFSCEQYFHRPFVLSLHRYCMVNEFGRECNEINFNKIYNLRWKSFFQDFDLSTEIQMLIFMKNFRTSTSQSSGLFIMHSYNVHSNISPTIFCWICFIREHQLWKIESEMNFSNPRKVQLLVSFCQLSLFVNE